MSRLNKTSCCGVREYEGVLEFTDLVQMFIDVYNRFYNIGYGQGWNSGAFILFTCPAQGRKIPRIIEFIEENNLGTSTLAPTEHNPNSGHNLQAMLWGVNHTEFKRWYRTTRPLNEYDIGERVLNVVEGARRNGQEATVQSVNGEDVTVMYQDGNIGTGQRRHYNRVDVV